MGKTTSFFSFFPLLTLGVDTRPDLDFTVHARVYGKVPQGLLSWWWSPLLAIRPLLHTVELVLLTTEVAPGRKPGRFGDNNLEQ